MGVGLGDEGAEIQALRAHAPQIRWFPEKAVVGDTVYSDIRVLGSGFRVSKIVSISFGGVLIRIMDLGVYWDPPMYGKYRISAAFAYVEILNPKA